MVGLNKKQVAEVRRLVQERHGHLRAKELVDAARDTKSPLHPCFTWDDTAAAEKCRLYEAKEVLRYVTVVFEPVPKRPPMEVRALISLPSDRGRGGGVYRDVTLVLKNKTQRQELLELALSELQALRRKYAMLTELAKVWRVIDKIKK